MARQKSGSATHKPTKQTWVLDVNVLYHAAAVGAGHAAKTAKNEPALEKQALRLLVNIEEMHQIAEDSSGRMAKECRTALERMLRDRRSYPSLDTAHNLWQALWDKPHFRGERTLPKDLRALCLAANMKVEGDIAYIEAAAATTDRLLCTHDPSDFTADICKELERQLAVRVLGYEAALEHARR